MIDIFSIVSSNPLVVLRGEYGIIKGENSIIASPDAKSGIVILISDAENKVSAMAHVDNEENIDQVLEKVIKDLVANGAEIKNLKCNLMGK